MTMKWRNKDKADTKTEAGEQSMEGVFGQLLSEMENNLYQRIEFLVKQSIEKHMFESAEDKTNEATTEETEKVEEVVQPFEETEVTIQSLLDRIIHLEEIIKSFRSEVSEQLAENEKLEDLLKDRNTVIQSYQEDVYRKITAPLIKQFISLADMMNAVLSSEEAQNADVEYWKLQFEKTIHSTQYILNDFSVNTYTESVEGSTFDPNRQEVASTYETTDESLDKKIHSSVCPGYTWTLPYILRPKANGEKHLQTSYEFIIRKEQVKTYKYINSNKDKENG